MRGRVLPQIPGPSDSLGPAILRMEMAFSSIQRGIALTASSFAVRKMSITRRGFPTRTAFRPRGGRLPMPAFAKDERPVGIENVFPGPLSVAPCLRLCHVVHGCHRPILRLPAFGYPVVFRDLILHSRTLLLEVDGSSRRCRAPLILLALRRSERRCGFD